MFSQLKKTLALSLLSCLSLTSCGSHPTVSENLLEETTAPSCIPLKALQLPKGISLPLESSDYQIPPEPLSSKIDYPIDLYPPLQLLPLLPGSEACYQGKQAILQLEPTVDTRLLWQRLKHSLVRQGIPTISHNDSKKITLTDWVKPYLLDGKTKYSACYQISLSPQVPAKLISELLSLAKVDYQYPQSLDRRGIPDKKEDNKRELSYQKKTPTPSEQRHYAIALLNRLVTDLTKQETAAAIPAQVTSSPKK